jgi:hypothetical protein
MAEQLVVNTEFERDFAKMTARQIIPKVMFYSMALRSRSGYSTLLNELRGLGSSPNENKTARRSKFIELAPELTAYLYDQTIDHFNPDVVETAVQRSINLAELSIKSDICYYRDHLVQIVNNTLDDQLTPHPT